MHSRVIKNITIAFVICLMLSLTGCAQIKSLPFLKGREQRQPVLSMANEETTIAESETMEEFDFDSMFEEETTVETTEFDYNEVVARMMGIDKSELLKFSEIVETSKDVEITTSSDIVEEETTEETITKEISEPTEVEETVENKEPQTLTYSRMKDFVLRNGSKSFTYKEGIFSYQSLAEVPQAIQCNFTFIDSGNKIEVEVERNGDLETEATKETTKITKENTKKETSKAGDISIIRDSDIVDLNNDNLTMKERYPALFAFEFDALYPETEEPETIETSKEAPKTAYAASDNKAPASEKTLQVNFDSKIYTLPAVSGYTQSNVASNQVRYKSNTTSDYFDVYFTSVNAAPNYRLIARDSLRLKYGDGTGAQGSSTVTNSYVVDTKYYSYTVTSTGKEYPIGYDLKVSNQKSICILDVAGLGTLSSQMSAVAKGITCKQ